MSIDINFWILSLLNRFIRHILTTMKLFCELNIGIIDIDQCIILTVPKKYMFLLVIHPFKRLDILIIKSRWADIGCTFLAFFEVFFEKKMVSCCDMVVLVSFDAPLRILQIELILLELVQNLPVYRDSMIPDNNSTHQGDILHLLAPGMLENLGHTVSFGRIYCEYIL